MYLTVPTGRVELRTRDFTLEPAMWQRLERTLLHEMGHVVNWSTGVRVDPAE